MFAQSFIRFLIKITDGDLMIQSTNDKGRTLIYNLNHQIIVRLGCSFEKPE